MSQEEEQVRKADQSLLSAEVDNLALPCPLLMFENGWTPPAACSKQLARTHTKVGFLDILSISYGTVSINAKNSQQPLYISRQKGKLHIRHRKGYSSHTKCKQANAFIIWYAPGGQAPTLLPAEAALDNADCATLDRTRNSQTKIRQNAKNSSQ